MSTGARAMVDQILRDPTASAWLKDALRAALRRDILNAYNDARVLAEVLAEAADAAIVDTFESLEGGDR